MLLEELLTTDLAAQIPRPLAYTLSIIFPWWWNSTCTVDLQIFQRLLQITSPRKNDRNLVSPDLTPEWWILTFRATRYILRYRPVSRLPHSGPRKIYHLSKEKKWRMRSGGNLLSTTSILWRLWGRLNGPSNSLSPSNLTVGQYWYIRQGVACKASERAELWWGTAFCVKAT